MSYIYSIIVAYSTGSGGDPTQSKVLIKNELYKTPKEAKTNLLKFLTESDVQKRTAKLKVPFFTAGSYLTVIYADSSSPTGQNKFTGICIARRNKSIGSTFIVRNVILNTSVEKMFELYSPCIIEIKVWPTIHSNILVYLCTLGLKIGKEKKS